MRTFPRGTSAMEDPAEQPRPRIQGHDTEGLERRIDLHRKEVAGFCHTGSGRACFRTSLRLGSWPGTPKLDAMLRSFAGRIMLAMTAGRHALDHLLAGFNVLQDAGKATRWPAARWIDAKASHDAALSGWADDDAMKRSTFASVVRVIVRPDFSRSTNLPSLTAFFPNVEGLMPCAEQYSLMRAMIVSFSMPPIMGKSPIKSNGKFAAASIFFGQRFSPAFRWMPWHAHFSRSARVHPPFSVRVASISSSVTALRSTFS